MFLFFFYINKSALVTNTTCHFLQEKQIHAIFSSDMLVTLYFNLYKYDYHKYTVFLVLVCLFLRKGYHFPDCHELK